MNNLICVRLKGDQDLKKEINLLCEQQGINAGAIISSVGSLKKINFRLANSKDFLQVTDFFEIVSLNGTVSKNGVHLHISVSDKNGQVFGGHLMDENIIYTTCELVLLRIDSFNFKRELDPSTKFKELKIEKNN